MNIDKAILSRTPQTIILDAQKCTVTGVECQIEVPFLEINIIKQHLKICLQKIVGE